MSYYTEDSEVNDIAVQERTEGLYVFKNRGLEYIIPWTEIDDMRLSVSDIDKLGKLPVGTVLRDAEGVVWESQYQPYLWFTTGVTKTFYVEHVALPAKILYKPEPNLGNL